jgi:hypothetical protein
VSVTADVTKITGGLRRYTEVMAKRTNGNGKAPGRYVLAREEFAAITAVEGLKLTAAAEKRLKETESLSPEERRAVIIRAYSGSRAR